MVSMKAWPLRGNESLAVAWAISFHVLSLIPITLIGLYYLMRSGLHLRDLREISR
jgi:hypothetical protein